MCYGFIPDILRICNKYNLLHVVNNYTKHGIFPSKSIWTRIVNSKIKTVFLSKIKQHCNDDPELSMFEIINDFTYFQPCFHWTVSRKDLRLKSSARVMVVAVCKVLSRQFAESCPYCLAQEVDSLVVHVVMHCYCNEIYRRQMFEYIVSNYGLDSFMIFCTFTPKVQVLHLLNYLKLFGCDSDRKRNLTKLGHIFLNMFRAPCFKISAT